MTESEGAVEAPKEPRLGPDGRPKPACPAGRPKPEWMRLAFHVLAISAAAVVCLFVTDPAWRLGLVGTALVLATLYELLRKLRGTAVGKALNGLRVRPREVRTRAASTDFVWAMSLCAYLFSPHVAATAFFVTAFADPMARLFGIYFGTVRWHRRTKKTVEGSIGFFLIAVTVIILHRPAPSLPVAVTAAVVATLAELRDQRVRMTRFGPILPPSDNFWIPVCTATTLEIFS